MDIRKVKADPAKQNKGVSFKFDDDTSFVIASTSGADYREALREGTESLRRTTRNPSARQILETERRVYAKMILVGWEGLKEDGKEVTYSEDKAYEIMMTCPDASDFVYLRSNDNANFRAEELEAAKAKLGE